MRISKTRTREQGHLLVFIMSAENCFVASLAMTALFDLESGPIGVELTFLATGLFCLML